MLRSLYTGDNLPILRGLNSDSVDLVYLDPPFNSNRNYAAPIGSAAEGAAFKDVWTLDDVTEAEHGLLADQSPALYEVIAASRVAHGAGMMAYLTMMGGRLLELRRVLRPSGSIYLHCDDTANAYLRMVMDAVFGKAAFRNEIIWKRQSSNNASGSKCGRVADHILFYAGSDAVWNSDVRHELSATELREYKPDVDGRMYKCENLTAPGGRRQFTWRGATPSPSRGWLFPADELEAMLKRGEIELGRNGNAKLRGRKRYLADNPGQKLQSIWTDIVRVGNTARERTGWATQKPLALLERIIRASSNEGDIILDPFCGCATACLAAEKLGRQWIGIDLSPLAVKIMKGRLTNELGLGGLDVAYYDQPPVRTDLAAPLPKPEIKHLLYGAQEGDCAGCLTHFPFRNLTIDRIQPGGQYHQDNTQLLCGACNSMKGRRSQAEFLARLREKGLRE